MMNGKQQARLEARAALIKALAHPSRLFIVEELSKGERCVCELTGMVGVDISTVSKHLAILRRAGIVESRKVGLQVYYRLRAACVLQFLECIEALRTAGAAPRRAVACCGGK